MLLRPNTRYRALVSMRRVVRAWDVRGRCFSSLPERVAAEAAAKRTSVAQREIRPHPKPFFSDATKVAMLVFGA